MPDNVAREPEFLSLQTRAYAPDYRRPAIDVSAMLDRNPHLETAIMEAGCMAGSGMAALEQRLSETAIRSTTAEGIESKHQDDLFSLSTSKFRPRHIRAYERFR